VRVTEVDGDVSGHGELAVPRHLHALIPGQRPDEVGREGGDGVEEGVTDVLGGMPVG
jgi:hypothetical protein